MSRSYKTRPISGICCCKSEKEDKKIWHRRFRSRTRDAINSMIMDEDWDMPVFSIRQVSNPWDMSKDGKCAVKELLGYKRQRLFWKQYKLYWCRRYLHPWDDWNKYKLSMRDRYHLFGK